ncbi:hypothetical protein F986_00572, partial [Acinetobacter johnsonii CIP 64.6]
HQFEDHQLIVKDRRFYIADRDNYPIAIFEYREALLHKDLKDNTLLI